MSRQTVIPVRFQPPCACEACQIAGVTERPRPIQPDLHGRELLQWWLSYEDFQRAWAALSIKSMPKAVVQTDLDGRPL